MKITLSFLFLMITLLVNAQKKEPFLFIPPSAAYIKADTVYEEERGVRYLNHYYQKAGGAYDLKNYSDCIPDSLSSCGCGYKQRYTNGILYEYNSCNESGMGIMIFLPTTDISIAIKFVGMVFRDEANVWSSDYREYGPKDTDAGCWYTIRKTDFGIFIEGYCGC